MCYNLQPQCYSSSLGVLSKSAIALFPSSFAHRCHVNQDQRQFFIQLAKEAGCRCHCVVLALPPKLCAARAAARVDHEGGVQGKGAPRVVNMMQSQMNKAGGSGMDRYISPVV